MRSSRELPICALGLALSVVASGCAPDELGPCELADVQHVYYDVGGFPSYGGQALLDRSCAGGVCHTSGIAAEQRFGVPAGLDFDVGIAVGDTPEEQAASLARLRRARRLVWNWRADLWKAVHRGFMPPEGDAATAEWRDADGFPLPEIRYYEGQQLLRNWLACGAPVVESTNGPASGDVGDVVPRREEIASCAEGSAFCDGACREVATDPAHCGACGVACGASQRCDAGLCACSAGLTACGAACVDLTTDATNCGACGRSCGALFCAAGTCTDTCPAGTTDCAGSCVDLATSAANCGSCGTVCRAGEACAGGACACALGLTACGGACVDVASDGRNCGACGAACPSGAACVGGACACPGGLRACGGACIDVATDGANCGACGVTCAAGQACRAGACEACGGTATLSSIQAATLTPSCATRGCHAGARPQAGLRLEPGTSWAELVGVGSTAAACRGRTLVVPGNAGASYLVDKLRGAAGICGSQMPKAGVSVSAAELAAIESWICNGARND
jgi:hypothetical protein